MANDNRYFIFRHWPKSRQENDFERWVWQSMTGRGERPSRLAELRGDRQHSDHPGGFGRPGIATLRVIICIKNIVMLQTGASPAVDRESDDLVKPRLVSDDVVSRRRNGCDNQGHFE